jgi:hypothetical protein
MGAIRAACAATGLNPSEAPYAYSIQSLAESALTKSNTMNPPIQMSDDGGTDTGYPAENSCAAIGLNPATAYRHCVSNLNQALFDEQNLAR